MALRDVAAQNASLDNDYGTTRGPHSADSWEVALLDQDDVELDAATSPGYARAVIAPADWRPADQGAKTVLVSFPAPTAEWMPATSWRLTDAATGVVWDAGDLVDPLLVTSAGDPAQVSLTVYYSPEL